MKMMFKIIALMATLLLAVNYAMPKVDVRTRKRFKKKAKRFQNRAGSVLYKVMEPLK